MAKEIIAWCDVCLHDDIKQPARTLAPMTLDASKPRVIDVCEVHEKEIVEPLRQLLAEFGQPVESSSSSSRDEQHPCPIASCGKSYVSAQSLGKHLRSKHNTTLSDALAGIDQPLPIEAELQHQCPEPDCARGFSTPQGLGAHRNRVHGYVSPHNEAIRANKAAAEKPKRGKKATT